MSYRYPFTPFPTGWYRITEKNNLVAAFGKKFILKKQSGCLTLQEITTPNTILPVIQKNNFLYAFYDKNHPNPFFDFPVIAEFTDPAWQKPFHLEWNNARLHVQEVAENALDLAHFSTIHTYHMIPELKKFEIQHHTFQVIMTSVRKTLGITTQTNMDITYHGLGIVHASVETSNNISLKVLLTTTPIDVETVDIVMDVAIKKTRNPIKNMLLKYLLPKDVKKEFTHDIPVWEAKIYPEKPAFCEKDANIVRIRKWAKQFYDDATP